MTEQKDYKDTVFLPKTDFPMKAGLPQKEPGILARWNEQDLYAKMREARAGREKFILHDGPPYANGDMHIGHALNHILKDMVCRTQTLLGKDAPYVPGWDCHGLPIEWKVEEQYRKKKLNKDEVPVKEFRAECRAYAQKWVDVAGRARQLGQAVSDDGFRQRSDDCVRAVEVCRWRPAVSRGKAGDVVAGGENRFGRG
jgi:isoleucyl-tRNA synthetase